MFLTVPQRLLLPLRQVSGEQFVLPTDGEHSDCVSQKIHNIEMISSFFSRLAVIQPHMVHCRIESIHPSTIHGDVSKSPRISISKFQNK